MYVRVSRAYDWIEREVCKGSEYAVEAGFDCGGNKPPIGPPTGVVSSDDNSNDEHRCQSEEQVGVE